MKNSIICWLILTLCLAVNARAKSVFVDTFENGVITNSDLESGFWTVDTEGVSFAYDEFGGRLMLISTQNISNVRTTASVQSAVDSRFDFFTPDGLTFSAKFDATFSAASSVAFVRFVLGPTAVGTPYHNEQNYLAVQMAANGGLSIRRRVDGSAVNLFSVISASIPIEMSLHLDSTSYSINFIFADNSSTNFTGAHGLNSLTWGSGSYVYFDSMTQSTAPDGTVSTLKLSEFTVSNNSVSSLKLLIISMLQHSLNDQFVPEKTIVRRCSEEDNF